MTHAELKEAIKTALKKGEEIQLSVLRSLLAAATNELVAQRRKPTEELSETEILELVRRSVKQHRESIDQFFKANRGDLASKETEELMFLETLLPPEMTPEEVDHLVQAKIKQMGITDKGKIGLVIGAVMKEAQGRTDGNVVKAAVEKAFA